MKKIFFLLAFTFIGQQVFSQIYLVSINGGNVNGCTDVNEITLTLVPPTGSQIQSCFNRTINGGALEYLNQELNNIVNQGYKLVETSYGNSYGEDIISSLIESNYNRLNIGTTFIFAVPWNPSGLEEVLQTLKNLNIYPNPANDFIEIVLDFEIKISSEIVIYSEAGYIYHKHKVSKLNKNEPYRLDISKIPAGKYFITIVNNKSYMTGERLIVI